MSGAKSVSECLCFVILFHLAYVTYIAIFCNVSLTLTLLCVLILIQLVLLNAPRFYVYGLTRVTTSLMVALFSSTDKLKNVWFNLFSVSV